MRAHENPRPSRKMGNSIAMAAMRGRSPFSTSGFSLEASFTATGMLCAKMFSRSLWKRSSVTITPMSSGNAFPSGTKMNGSFANAPFLISGMELFLIDHVLERRHADAAIGVEQALAIHAKFQIGVHHAFDRIDDLVLAETGAHDFADARIFRARAAKLDLIELHAFFIDAQNADMARVMMAAGVDAAAHLDLEFAQFVLPFEIGEALLNRLRNRNGTRIGEIAIIKPGAADDVGDKARIRGGEVQHLQPRENHGQIALLHMRQNEVLFMRDADFLIAEIVHQLRQRIHLIRARIAGRGANRL